MSTYQPAGGVSVIGTTAGATVVDVEVLDETGALVLVLPHLPLNHTFTVTASMFADGKFPDAMQIGKGMLCICNCYCTC